MMLPLPLLDEWLSMALKEDLGAGDVTTDSLIPPDRWGKAELVAKESFVLAGLPVALRVFTLLSESFQKDVAASEGETLRKGDILATLEGPLRAILKGERVSLNILQHLSGVATMTRRFVGAVTGTGTKILDTRKTLPGMRALEKYAVRVGGGRNHRASLSEGVLIKENHVLACGGIAEALRTMRNNTPQMLRIEVEVRNLEETAEALEAKADMILLDNMPVATILEAVNLVKGRIPLEVSGGVSLDNVRSIAETGVCAISVGRLTHSAPGVDISLMVKHAWSKDTEREDLQASL